VNDKVLTDCKSSSRTKTFLNPKGVYFHALVTLQCVKFHRAIGKRSKTRKTRFSFCKAIENETDNNSGIHLPPQIITITLQNLIDCFCLKIYSFKYTLCLKKPDRCNKRHNFVTSQHLLIIFGRDRHYSILARLR